MFGVLFNDKKEKIMKQSSADGSRRQSWVGRRMSVQSNMSNGTTSASRDLDQRRKSDSSAPVKKERICVISPAKDENTRGGNDITQCQMLCEKYHVETNHKEYFIKTYADVKRLYPDALFEYYEKQFAQQKKRK